MSIKVSQLTKLYGEQKAVDGISFELQKGEIVGFLGPNGAGKSTTMKIITGYLPPTEGEAAVCGFDVLKSTMDVRKRVGYLPEANPLYPDMYIREFLEFSAGMHRLGGQTGRLISDMIRRTGLTPEQHKKIGALSKGYKQRVGLAQALLHNPEVLILDEPTSGLDPNQLVEIRNLIRELGHDKTVMLSTHIMQEVEAMCSRVIIINKGKIIADDAISVLRQGANSYIQVTFGEAATAEELERLPGVTRAVAAEGHAWRLYTQDAETVRKNLLQFALINNRNILSLHSNSQSLEDVFRELTN
ncbi:gliding motility-associated ABC transporter ATP-binding subunit GldA [Chitinophaga sp. GCM10012297]|uniref:Gliding motility-associated ABC transporter ATP-binding subunit GldA n=1 Tax=Chitinophaga chungangae TaxID=2821488 RepID=A0ABS3YFD8_9BACT|nr:gliding motility-associated ABC transporter ATP-binding subunit GldA [Chitinophaga chungangae]MBO9153395.1 gliding motility-associated ABC transporter ATP-binding subunit GldA [Chitinophaga chungangae]